jgi:hypothetical protein
MHAFLQRWNKTFRRYGGYNTNNNVCSKAVVNLGQIFKSKARIALKKSWSSIHPPINILVTHYFKKRFIQHHDYLICFIKVSNHYYLLFCTFLHTFLLRIYKCRKDHSCARFRYLLWEPPSLLIFGTSKCQTSQNGSVF